MQLPTETESATEAPSSTDTPLAVVNTALAMQVGSTYAYIDGSVLVAVPGGVFQMGGDGADNQEHSVTLDDFWIYSTEVTNQQYALCEKLGFCTPPDLKVHPRYIYPEYSNHPVVGVSYEQAATYCSFVNGRLPTEAEWEKAARGPDGDAYPWGDADPSCDLANFSTCASKPDQVLSHPGGASFYGALDMAGNVFEWTADWYAADSYQTSPSENPSGPESGSERSIRSSAFDSAVADLSAVSRYSDDPTSVRDDLGFRCVVDEPVHFAPLCTMPSAYEAGVASEVCPNVSINQYPGCAKKLPVTNVGFVGPEDAVVNPGGCAPTNDPNVFACVGGGQVSISASCQVSTTGEPACPDGYSLEGSVCKVNESGTGACLPGMEFDSASGCCAVQAQASDPVEPVCPVGTYFVDGQNFCASEPLQGIVSVVQSIQFRGSCEGDGKGAPVPACKEPAGGCGYRMKWAPADCKCVPD